MISIIIPSYNGQKTIDKTINSIYSSNNINRLNFEILVIDDVSIDGSYKFVKQHFPTVKLFKLKKHSGATSARNKGIKKSKGELLLFIDNDIHFNKSTITTLINSVDENIDIYFPKITYENGHVLYPVLETEKTYPHISGCFLIKKKSLKKLDEYFDEFYETYLEDYDFFMRCNFAELKAKYVEHARVIHANKENKDFSYRYYLEVRNLVYGYLKMRNLRKKSKFYNPFTLSSIVKAFYLGLCNFAWFNWYSYDRKLVKKEKLKLLFQGKNKISEKKGLNNIILFFKAISDIVSNLKKIKKKRIKVRNYFKMI